MHRQNKIAIIISAFLTMILYPLYCSANPGTCDILDIGSIIGLVVLLILMFIGSLIFVWFIAALVGIDIQKPEREMFEQIKKEKREKIEKIEKELDKKSWRIINKYVEKNIENINESKFPGSFELNDLLQIKYGIEINHSELIEILKNKANEYNEKGEERKYTIFKKIILSEKPKTKEDYADALLKHFGEDSTKNIVFLTKLLNQNGFNMGDNEAEIFLKNRKKKIELERYEKSILSDRTIEKPSIGEMSGYEFESFLGNLFKKMGYKVIKTKLSGDQGADLIVERFGEKIAVQAKCYSGTVGNKAIQEVVAAKNHYKCDKAMVITTSYFTRHALNLAKSNDVELWNRNKLEEMIKRCNAFEPDQNEDDTDELNEDVELPICKICGVNTTINPDKICDDCKFSMISNDDVPPNM